MTARTLKTVGDLVTMISDLLRSSNDGIARHTRTLVGPRTRGSTTERGLEALPPKTPLEPLENDALTGHTRAFTFRDPLFQLGGVLRADTLLTVLGRGDVVKIREGAHGSELFVDAPIETAYAPFTSAYTVILGEEAGEECVFTWHPGPPMRPFAGELRKDCAVKLHNGN